MKKHLFLFILMLLPILASAQTVSDVQNSGCLNEKLGDESQRVPTIVLTKEGSTLSVQLLNYEENCCTEDFNATYSISGGSDSELCSVSINVAPTIEYNCDCICPFNLSFTVRDLVPNIFYLDCWWCKKWVKLTEGESMVMAFIDGIYYELLPSVNEAEVITNLYTGNVEIPEKVVYDGTEYRVTRIQAYAFSMCDALTSVTIPNSVKSIGHSVFDGCTGLTSITIPNSITNIEDDTFANCTSLTSLNIPNSITNIEDAAFANCTSLTSLNIPNSVTSIGMSAFSGCKGLTSVTLPNSLPCIRGYVFAGCSGLTSIDIPNSVTSIEEGAFNGCVNLKDIYCWPENVPSTDVDVFQNFNIGDVTLHVPAASVSAYQAVEPWKGFKEIVALTNNTDTPKYFPTGMTWEEVGVTPDMGREYYNAHIYEISTDTIIGNVTYRKVLRDNVFSGLCVRESGDKVWLLTKDYPTEILLYNFDWDSNQEVVTEYLKGQEVIGFIGQNMEDYEVRQETTPVGDSQTVVIDGKTYQYYKRFSGTIIRGIGKVSELNRYPCLLSYREPAVILPGIEYFKVRWIKRNGVEIFRSEYAREWTMEIKNDYRPFVEEGKVWKVGTISGNPVQIVDYYYFDGDTIIDGKTCKQMMCQRFVSPDYSNEYWTPKPFLKKVGAWYEEDKKVYFYDEITQSMRLMYDFSLDDYETVDFLNMDGYPPFIIGPKQTGGVKGFKGVYRDIVMCADEGQHFHSTFWLEGVGDINGPTRIPIDPILDDPVPEFLMSCVVGDEVIYYNDEYEDGATPAGARKNRFDFTHTPKIQPKTRISRGEEPLDLWSLATNGTQESVYGEYNDLQLGINLDPLDDAYLVSITNDSGKTVYEKTINAGNIVGLNIDISAYAKGRYTVTVENSRESFTGEFETLTTGISDAVRLNDNGKMINDKHIYNLQGQRLSRLQKGLNIVNGRKIYVKD